METDPSASPQKLNVTPKETSFIMGDAIFLPFDGVFLLPALLTIP